MSNYPITLLPVSQLPFAKERLAQLEQIMRALPGLLPERLEDIPTFAGELLTRRHMPGPDTVPRLRRTGSEEARNDLDTIVDLCSRLGIALYDLSRTAVEALDHKRFPEHPIKIADDLVVLAEAAAEAIAKLAASPVVDPPAGSGSRRPREIVRAVERIYTQLTGEEFTINTRVPGGRLQVESDAVKFARRIFDCLKMENSPLVAIKTLRAARNKAG